MVSADIAPKERFVVLDGMRGLAALVVITDHVASPVLMNLLPGRYLAVDFFFVLSGFVLAHVYGERLKSGLSFNGFMHIRLVRLYPLYLVGAALGGILALIYALRGWADYSVATVIASSLVALTMLPCPPGLSLWPNAPYPLNGPSWSLFFELFVNAIFAATARWLTPRFCLVFMAIAGVLLVPTAFGFGQLDGGFAWDNFIAGFPRVVFGFFTGVFIYQTRLYERVRALPAWVAYVALLLVFMAPATGIWRAAYDLLAALLLFPALVTLCANSHASGALNWLSATIGALSYGVYILHVPLWGWFTIAIARFQLDLPGIVNVAIVAVVALLAAAVLDQIYDRPVRKMLSRKRPAASATGS